MPEWPKKPLGEVATLQRGFDLPVQSRTEGKFPIFAANGSVGTHIEAKVVGPGVVTGRSGSIGKVHYVEGDFWPLNTALWVKDFHGNNPEWVFYLLQWFGLERFARGGAVPTLNRNLVHSELVPASPFDEQQRIVSRIKECLSRIEEVESLRAQAVVEAAAVLPSMLNSEFLQQREEYGSAEIGDLAVETRYGTSSKCTTTPNGTAILRIPNVAGGFVNLNNLKYCQLAERDLDRLTLQQGDLLFVRTNGSRELVGRCAIFEEGQDERFAFASYLIRVRLAEDRMRPHFLSFFLSSTQGRNELDKRRRTSAGQFNINSENLRSIEVPVPPLEVQDALIERLRVQQDSVIALRDSLADVDAESSHLRESILRKAFAGEL